MSDDKPDRVEQLVGRARGSVAIVWDSVTTAVTWRRVRIAFGIVLLLTVPPAVIYAVYLSTGSALDTIIYISVFTVSFAFIPVAINLFGKSIPGSAGLGKGHFILGNFAANKPYLVQIGDKYRLCIGTANSYYLDGEWQEIEDGLQNKTILGWREFGFVWHKREEDIEQLKADRAVGDGGVEMIERGGVQAQSPSTDNFECKSCSEPVTMDDGFCSNCGMVVDIDSMQADQSNWLISLHRLYGKGLEQIGNIDLLEVAEEQAKRAEVSGGVVSEWSRVIASLGGLLLGFLFGYVLFYLG